MYGGVNYEAIIKEYSDVLSSILGTSDSNRLTSIIKSKISKPNEKYTKWIITSFIDSQPVETDAWFTEINSALDQYRALVSMRKVSPSKGIYHYCGTTGCRNKPGLNTLLENCGALESRSKQTKRLKKEIAEKIETVLDNAEVKVIIALSHKAAQFYGQMTKWCTSGRNISSYAQYSSKGPIYIVLSKGPDKDKFQFHVETNSVYDRLDRRISIVYLLDRFPSLIELEPVKQLLANWRITEMVKDFLHGKMVKDFLYSNSEFVVPELPKKVYKRAVIIVDDFFVVDKAIDSKMANVIKALGELGVVLDDETVIDRYENPDVIKAMPRTWLSLVEYGQQFDMMPDIDRRSRVELVFENLIESYSDQQKIKTAQALLKKTQKLL